MKRLPSLKKNLKKPEKKPEKKQSALTSTSHFLVLAATTTGYLIFGPRSTACVGLDLTNTVLQPRSSAGHCASPQVGNGFGAHVPCVGTDY